MLLKKLLEMTKQIPYKNYLGFILILYFATTVFIKYKSYTFLHGDGVFYANINRAIAQHFTTRQEAYTPNSWYFSNLPWNNNLPQDWSNISKGKNGEIYPKHPVIMPIFSTFFFILFSYDGLLLFNFLMLLGFFYFLNKNFSLQKNEIIISTLILLIALNPFFVRAVYSYSNDLFYSLILLVAMYLTYKDLYLFAGLSGGIAIWGKISNIIPLFFMIAIIIFNKQSNISSTEFAKKIKNNIIKFVLGLGIIIFIYAIYNTVRFGLPWITSYDRILIRKNGAITIDSARNALDTPFYKGLKELINNKKEGLLYNFPFLIPAFFGFIVMVTQKKWKIVILNALPLIFFLSFFSLYDFKYARFFVAYIPFLLLPYYDLLEFCIKSFLAIKKTVYQLYLINRKKIIVILTSIAIVLITTSIIYKKDFVYKDNLLSGLIEKAKLTLNKKIPCDFFNPRTQKWECSSFDNTDNDQVGLSTNAECAGKKMIYFPIRHKIGNKLLTFPFNETVNFLKFNYIIDSCNSSEILIYADGKIVRIIKIKKEKNIGNLKFALKNAHIISISVHAKNDCIICFDAIIFNN